MAEVFCRDCEWVIYFYTMKRKTYSEKLLDPRWQKKRLEVMKRDHFKCKLCKDGTSTLHIHHKSYNSEPWTVKNDELITLCEKCHFLVEFYTKRNEKITSIKRIINDDGTNLTMVKVKDHCDIYVTFPNDVPIGFRVYENEFSGILKFMKSGRLDKIT